MMGVFDFTKLRMLRSERQSASSSETHMFTATKRNQYINLEIGWTYSLLPLTFATRWNQKHSSYVSIRLLAKFHRAALLRRADYMRCLKLLTS